MEAGIDQVCHCCSIYAVPGAAVWMLGPDAWCLLAACEAQAACLQLLCSLLHDAS